MPPALFPSAYIAFTVLSGDDSDAFSRPLVAAVRDTLLALQCGACSV